MDEKLKRIIETRLEDMIEPRRLEPKDERRPWTWEELVEYEPRLITVLWAAEHIDHNPNMVDALYHYVFKPIVSELVGWECKRLPCLRTMKAYDAAIFKIIDTLEIDS